MRNNDSPETFESQDLLQRSSLVHSIADELRSLDLEYGAVTALVGPWGVGKSTLLEFIKPHLGSKHTVVEFNPRLFSSAEDLVVTFFKELQRVLSLKGERQFSDVLKALGPYIAALEYLKFEPNLVAIGWVAGAAKKLTGRKPPTVVETKNALTETLKVSDRRIVVFIDDLDRLNPKEVLEVLRLVRLVGSLPNVLYVLAYDEERLTKLLNNEGVGGDDYLEKIVYVTWRVPGVDLGNRRRLIYDGLDQILEGHSTHISPQDEDRLGRIVEELLIHYLTNIRRIKRYLAAVQLTIQQLVGEIDIADLLCLEALRLYEKGTFDCIVGSASSLSWSKDFIELFDEERKKKSAYDLLRLLGDNPAPHLVWATKELFPLAWHSNNPSLPSPSLDTLLSRNRVGHIAVLLNYLDRFESRELTSRRKFGRILEEEIGVEANLEELESGTFDEAVDICDLLFQNLASVPTLKATFLASYFLDHSTLSRGKSQSLRSIGYSMDARKLALGFLELLPQDQRSTAEEKIYSLMKSVEARFMFVYDLEHPDDRLHVPDSPLVQHALKLRLLKDFSGLTASELEETGRLCWIAVSLKDELNIANLDMPNFMSSPPAAWNLLISSVAVRASSSMNRPDVAALSTILGKNGLFKFLQFLCQNKSSKNADTLILDFAITDSGYATNLTD